MAGGEVMKNYFIRRLTLIGFHPSITFTITLQLLHRRLMKLKVTVEG